MRSRRGVVLLTAVVFAMVGSAAAQTDHFHPKGKPEGYQAEDADLTITINRSDLEMQHE